MSKDGEEHAGEGGESAADRVKSSKAMSMSEVWNYAKRRDEQS